jgi:hypothetical protein
MRKHWTEESSVFILILNMGLKSENNPNFFFLTYPPALPKWEGGWSVDGHDDCPRMALFEDGLASPHLGETGEGFCCVL